MNHSVEVPTVEGLYHQGAWNQPLSPELGSPVHAHSPLGTVYSPTSPILSHAGSPPQMGCCSPMAPAHSPVMHAVHSPHSIMNGSPPPLSVKQECLGGDDMGYATSDNCGSLSTLLRTSTQELANIQMVAATHGCQFGTPREILDGEGLYVCI